MSRIEKARERWAAIGLAPAKPLVAKEIGEVLQPLCPSNLEILVYDSPRAALHKAIARSPDERNHWASLSHLAALSLRAQRFLGRKRFDYLQKHVREPLYAIFSPLQETLVRALAQQLARPLSLVPGQYGGHLPLRYGAWEAPTLAFYEVLTQVGFPSAEEFSPFWKLTELGVGMWWAAGTTVYLSPLPHRCCRNGAGVLHAEGGPALEYASGWRVWALNGTLVPRAAAELAPEEIPCELLLQERNAQVRREILQRIGVERALRDLNATVLDRKGTYELLNLDLRDGQPRPYLKMLNPSVGCWHLEAVPPGLNTVRRALHWRNGTDETPVVLT